MSQQRRQAGLGQRRRLASAPLGQRARKLAWVRPLRLERLEERRLLSITVDTLVDEADGSIVDGDISLRDAIAAAPAGETIDFSVTGTINLSVGPGAFNTRLTINKSLAINGPGANLLTINAFDPTPASKISDGGQVFFIDDGDNSNLIDVELNGLTLTGADSSTYGGAIRTLENLTVIESTISGNAAAFGGGGISCVYGHLRVTESTISGNSVINGPGGGIRCNRGALTITASTISDNSVTVLPGYESNGGGVWHFSGNLTVVGSTISGNHADLGGGIYNNFGFPTITGSTISGNTAISSGGGIYSINALMTIQASTITANEAPHSQGSGVAMKGAVGGSTRIELYSSIVAGNIHSDVDLLPGSELNDFRSNGFNLIGTGNATDAFFQFGDQTGIANPLLGPLADNGGPTRTHALLAGSPAIDMGDPAVVFNPAESDQRGNQFVRVFDGDGDATARIDIGAYERQQFNLVVDTLADESDDDFSLGDLSLREAIEISNLAPEVDSIEFIAALSGGTFVLTRGELRINRSVTIVGPGADLLTIDASGNDPTPMLNNGDGSRVLNIDNGKIGVKISVGIAGVTLTGGDVNGSGGGILAFGEDVSIVGSTIIDNAATATGGGLHTRPGNGTGTVVTVTSSTISGNSAANGGGIYNQFDYITLTVTDSTISGNAAKTHGGGINSPFGVVRLVHSTITGNVADSDQNNSGQGGGIAIFNNPYDGAVNVKLDHTIVAGNIRGASMRSDIAGPIAGARFSLIGDNTGASLVNNGGNLIGTSALPIDPMLDSLADNGGPAMTHALLPGSPAIDMGDPNFMAPPAYDQRGAGFDRVVGGRIDTGAYEVQAVAPPSADFDDDDDVDGADFLTWQRGLGMTSGAIRENGDADGDGDVDDQDLGVWTTTFDPENFVASAGGLTPAYERQPSAATLADATLADLAMAQAMLANEDWTSPRFRFGRGVSRPR